MSRRIISFGELESPFKELIEYRTPGKTEPKLFVSELFHETIQGEGVTVGAPAVFLRLGGCTLNCKWCDTKEVWMSGKWYSISTLIEIMNISGVLTDFVFHNSFVLTGGSPLLQQVGIIELLRVLKKEFNLSPSVEIENECVISPDPELIELVSVWNNSPKLSNSGNPKEKRYHPEVLKQMGELKNSWFKFVVSKEKDVQEIFDEYILTKYIKREQILLMPEGSTRRKQRRNSERVIKWCRKSGFRYSPRLQVLLWDDAISV